MVQIITINKSGVVNETISKKQTIEEITTQHCPKSALGRSGYSCKTVWSVKLHDNDVRIHLWATNKGRAGSENKYDFPPPVDKDLYYGNCVIVATNTDGISLVDITKSDWKKIYEKLFGGFEDLVSESESEDELDSVPSEMKTGEGYLKDNFVVGSDDDSSPHSVHSSDDEPEAVSDSGSDSDVNYGSDESDEDGSELESDEYDDDDDDDVDVSDSE